MQRNRITLGFEFSGPAFLKQADSEWLKRQSEQHYKHYICWLPEQIDQISPPYKTFVCNWVGPHVLGNSYLRQIGREQIPALYLGYWVPKYHIEWQILFKHMGLAADNGQLKQLSFQRVGHSDEYRHAFPNVAFWLARKKYQPDGIGSWFARCLTLQEDRKIWVHNKDKQFVTPVAQRGSRHPELSGTPARTTPTKGKGKAKKETGHRNLRGRSPTGRGTRRRNGNNAAGGSSGYWRKAPINSWSRSNLGSGSRSNLGSESRSTSKHIEERRGVLDLHQNVNF